MRDFLIGAIIFFVLTMGAIYGLMNLDEYRCAKTWADSGYKARLNFGCQVEVDGRWFPADHIQIKR